MKKSIILILVAMITLALLSSIVLATSPLTVTDDPTNITTNSYVAPITNTNSNSVASNTLTNNVTNNLTTGNTVLPNTSNTLVSNSVTGNTVTTQPVTNSVVDNNGMLSSNTLDNNYIAPMPETSTPIVGNEENTLTQNPTVTPTVDSSAGELEVGTIVNILLIVVGIVIILLGFAILVKSR